MAVTSRPVRDPGELGVRIARMYRVDKLSLRAIGREVGLSAEMVRRYLLAMGIELRQPVAAIMLERHLHDGNYNEKRALEPRKAGCFVADCRQTRYVTSAGFMLGGCLYHVKRAMGLISS